VSRLRIQFGAPGHFIAADSCRYHLHTHIGKWCVSTVGEYFPAKGEKMETVGLSRFYETMVFNTKSRRSRWQEVDFGAYQTRAQADKGHEALCKKFEVRP
jgi:hypothetical protein